MQRICGICSQSCIYVYIWKYLWNFVVFKKWKLLLILPNCKNIYGSLEIKWYVVCRDIWLNCSSDSGRFRRLWYLGFSPSQFGVAICGPWQCKIIYFVYENLYNTVKVLKYDLIIYGGSLFLCIYIVLHTCLGDQI